MNLRDTSGTTDENDFIDIVLSKVRVFENLLDRFHVPEEIHAEFLELGTGKRPREVAAVLKVLDSTTSGVLARGSAPNFRLEFTKSLEILANVDTSLLLVLPTEVVDNMVTEVFTTKVGITSGSHNLDDTNVNGKEGHINDSSFGVVDDDLAFVFLRLVKTVGDSSGGGLIDDMQDLDTGNNAGILGGLWLDIECS